MVRWSVKARANLNAISTYLDTINPDVSFRVERAIVEKANWLAASPINAMSGSAIEGLAQKYLRAFVLKQSYRIYYKIQGPKTVKILLVYHSRQKPPTVKEILAADK